MSVYFDNAATTPVAPEVLAAMLPYFSAEWGNAQSVHSYGQRAKAAIEAARREVARLINASPTEIVFVSGGTEADNLALRGVATSHAAAGRHIITTAIEHPAVLATCEALQGDGFEVTFLPVSSRGVVSVDDLRKAIRPDTIVVSVMHANNETGTIQPLAEVGRVIAEARSNRAGALYFHSDAVQSAGKIPVNVAELGVDLLSLSAHKIHGPKGVGALYVRKGVRLVKQTFGGHQERDRRPGTENVPGIVGFGRAAQLMLQAFDDRNRAIAALRDDLEARVLGRVAGASVNGDRERRLPTVTNMSFAGLDGESLLIALDLAGIAVSTGSACSSGSTEPSHVLRALGLTREQVRGSLRLSLSGYTTPRDVATVVDKLVETVDRFRRMSPDGGAEPGRQAVV